MNCLLNYECLTRFKQEFYKNLLTHEHVQGGQIQINTVVLPSGEKYEGYNFWGYKLQKGGVKYLLPSRLRDDREIDLRTTLPVLVTASEKLSYKGEVYKLIVSYQSARFRPEKKMTFREMVDKLASFEHSNPEHYRIYWMMNLSQMMSRANYRTASPAAFGKDSVVDTLAHLVGGCSTIVNPTRAKMEYRTMYKMLAVNEVASIPAAEWTLIEQFLLDAGAFKPQLEKQTRAWGNTGEVLDISEFSLSLLYNDIDHYPNLDKYLDKKAHKALLNRFPPLRFWGVLKEDFNNVKKINVAKFVEEHEQEYKDLIYTYTYYSKNILSETKGFVSQLQQQDYPERWKTNLATLLLMVDLYSETQEEFTKWEQLVHNSLTDYRDMLFFPELLERVKKRQPLKEFNETKEQLRKHNTFTSKNAFLLSIISGDNVVFKDSKELWNK